MTNDLAICLNADDAFLLGKFRRREEIEVCTDPQGIWLRAKAATEELAAEFRTLPGMHFSVLPDGQLLSFGKLVPCGRLPQRSWQRLSHWINVEMTTPLPSGLVEVRTPLQLVHSTEIEEPNVLFASFATWHNYAVQAPRIRLEPLSFAVAEAGQVVISGTPLPPFAGVRYVEKSHLAVQAGWRWNYEVSAHVVRTALQLDKSAFAIFHADQTWDLIPEDAFVRATRSAVRLSWESFHHG